MKKKTDENRSGISHLPFYVYIDVGSIIFYKYYKHTHVNKMK